MATEKTTSTKTDAQLLKEQSKAVDELRARLNSQSLPKLQTIFMLNYTASVIATEVAAAQANTKARGVKKAGDAMTAAKVDLDAIAAQIADAAQKIVETALAKK